MKHRWALILMALLSSMTMITIARSAAPDKVRYENPVLGLAFNHAPGLQVVADQYLFESYGVTIAALEESHSTDQAAPPAIRIGWLHRRGAAELDKHAAAFRADFPDLPIRQREAKIAGTRAIIFEHAPGRVVSTYIYLAAQGRLFEIIVPAPELRTEDWQLLSSLTFLPARQKLASLNLTRAEDALYNRPQNAADLAPKMNLESAPQPTSGKPLPDMQPMAIAGCVDYPTWKFLQTPFTSIANGNGWSMAGGSFYGEGAHQDCANSSKANDHYALDMPLRFWDPVLAGCSPGVVKYADWAKDGWAAYGRIVVIDCGNGYWSQSAHLRGINVRAGDLVNSSTVIGWAGGSGHQKEDNFNPHLHEAFYLYPSFDYGRGGIYGGQSAQRVKVSYFRNGSNYYWYIQRSQSLSW